IAWSLDGRRVAVADAQLDRERKLFSKVSVYDVKTGLVFGQEHRGDTVNAVALRGRDTLVVARGDGTVHFEEMVGPGFTNTDPLVHPSEVLDMVACRKSSVLATTTLGAQADDDSPPITNTLGKKPPKGSCDAVHLWDPIMGWRLTPPLEHRQRVQGMEVTADGKYLLTLAGSEGNKEVRLWEIPPTSRHLENPASVFDDDAMLAFSEDGRRLLIDDSVQRRVWDLATDKLLTTSKAKPFPTRPVRDYVMVPLNSKVKAKILTRTGQRVETE